MLFHKNFVAPYSKRSPFTKTPAGIARAENPAGK